MAAFLYDLAQWREFSLDHAQSDAEREEIEGEYTQRLAAGRENLSHSYRAGSDFSEPIRHELDDEGKRKILAGFDAVQAWQFERQRKHRGQAVSFRYKEVLKYLLSLAVKHGQVFPKLDTIALAVRCSRRTVCNALAWLKLWGFLSWQRRMKRVATRIGVKVRQTSNAYRLKLSKLAALGSAIFQRKRECNNFTRSEKQRKTSNLESTFLTSGYRQKEAEAGVGVPIVNQAISELAQRLKASRPAVYGRAS